MTKPLSPTAQAVLDAAVLPCTIREGIAAAIRAVADQVVPEAANAVGDEHDEARLDQWLRIRWKILAIATELAGGTAMTTSQSRAQRLVDEFEEGAPASFLGGGRSSLRRGIARVLRHIAVTESDPESFNAVPARTLEDLADTLEAPTLFDRAMAGDASAARQFLYEAGFTDASGNWLPQYQQEEEVFTRFIEVGQASE